MISFIAFESKKLFFSFIPKKMCIRPSRHPIRNDVHVKNQNQPKRSLLKKAKAVFNIINFSLNGFESTQAQRNVTNEPFPQRNSSPGRSPLMKALTIAPTNPRRSMSLAAPDLKEREISPKTRFDDMPFG